MRTQRAYPFGGRLLVLLGTNVLESSFAQSSLSTQRRTKRVLPLKVLPISADLPPLHNAPSPSRGGWGWGWVFGGLKHPIPLLASPLKYPQGIKGRKINSGRSTLIMNSDFLCALCALDPSGPLQFITYLWRNRCSADTQGRFPL